MSKVKGNPLEPARILELLVSEPWTKEKKSQLQESVVARLMSGIEWVDEGLWVSPSSLLQYVYLTILQAQVFDHIPPVDAIDFSTYRNASRQCNRESNLSQRLHKRHKVCI
jgi:hypothetical protein